MKRILSLILVVVMTMAMSVNAFAAELKSFRDVPTSHWAHDAIMEMVDMGLLAGTVSPNANGVGEFNPGGIMKRSHFVVVMARYLYGNELESMPAGNSWYSNAYTLLVNNGVLTNSDFDYGNLEVGMTRQEMAYVLANAANVEGKTPTNLVNSSRIPDYNSVNAYYRESVLKAYSMGLITGVDKQGTFNPNGTLNRAQASAVIYRLINYTGIVEETPKVEDGYTGVGVNGKAYFDPNNPVVNMPNTATVLEQYGKECTGTGNTLTAAGIGVAAEGNGIWIRGWTWDNDDTYAVGCAYIKDLLDAESSAALLKWLDGANKILVENTNYLMNSDDFSEIKYKEMMNKYLDYIAPVKNADSPVKFGNVTLEWTEEGFCINLYIANP